MDKSKLHTEIHNGIMYLLSKDITAEKLQSTIESLVDEYHESEVEKLNLTKRKFAIFSDIVSYFINPYKKYDGEWKGLSHYEKMSNRRNSFNYVIIITIIVVGILLLWLWKI